MNRYFKIHSAPEKDTILPRRPHDIPRTINEMFRDFSKVERLVQQSFKMHMHGNVNDTV
jgi:hypothetical protein